MKKIILGIGIGIIVVLVIAVLVVGTHLDGIIKTGVETVGPKITQTTLTVEAVNVSLLGGSASVKALVLGNPAGCKAPQAISIGTTAVSLAPGSILSDKIVIHSVEIRDADVTFEGNPFGANNLTKIMDNVNGTTTSATGTGAAAPAGEKKPAKKFEVDDLLISGAKIHANLTGGLVSREVTLPLPDIHLTDLGQGNDGITAADLTKKILGEITTGTITALVSYASSLSKDVTGAAKSVGEEAAKAAGEGVNKLKQGLGNLLGK